jgi:hypothetical protein
VTTKGILSLESVDDIEVVSTRLHDWWLDVEGISHDPQKHELTMPFDERDGLARLLRWAGSEVTLKIAGVVDHVIRDTEHVRLYDLASIRVVRDRLEFRFGVTLSIDVRVAWLPVA